MLDADFDSFQSMLDTACSAISRGKYTPDAEATALCFEALRAYDLRTVSAAFAAHIKDPVRGKFPPVPADLIAQIEAAMTNSRPGVEEAWALIPASESDTIVWTAEMAEAHAACAPLLAEGDRIAARMTFKEVYTKAVQRAVSAGVPVQWSASLGWDLEKRKRVLLAAVEAGKLPALAARDECPALPLTTTEKLALPAPNPVRREDYRAKVTALVDAKRNPDSAADPKAWARELKRRDEAGEPAPNGEPITLELREAYKRALHYAPDDSGLFGAGTPIPIESFPPAMRAERAAAYRRATAKSQQQGDPRDAS